MTQEISSVLDALGLDLEELDWQKLAICNGQDTWRWYEGYESSARVAQLTDEICLSCPVRRECLEAGIENSEYGCWGGVFLTAGRVDEQRNAHKTQDIWEQIRESIVSADEVSDT